MECVAVPSTTGSQPIGPFWHLIEHPEWADLTRFGAAGDRITLTGSIVDGDDNPVTDAAVELWQADPPADEHFPAFGRSRTDERGEFRFTTIRPGPVPGRGNAQQAPHINIAVFARGLLKQLFTRLYFADEPRNDADPVLQSIDDAAVRQTLLARPGAGTPRIYRFDIVLQGERETAFFDV